MSIKEIKESAIFIADAHYPNHGDEFLKILEALEKKEITAPQLFLMGDIFDLLFGHNIYIKKFSNSAITILQRLSKEMEIYYIEGNHDFCLKEIFPHIALYPIEHQPVEFKLGNREIYLAHGDIHSRNLIYKLYSKLLRSRVTLTLLKIFEKPIIDYYISKLKSKNICFEFKNFHDEVENIIKKYPPNSLIVEGHFHQGKIFKNYISLPSLACSSMVGMVKNSNITLIKIDIV